MADDNIMNELGHTKYPKYVYPNEIKDEKGKVTERGEGVIVNNEAEEKEAMKDADTKQPAWDTGKKK